jgi:hypothetical protein
MFKISGVSVRDKPIQLSLMFAGKAKDQVKHLSRVGLTANIRLGWSGTKTYQEN